MFEPLYDLSERAEVHFIGCASDRARYDFSIVYTNQFFGKPMVICMQTGRTTLLSAEDLYDTDYIQRTFHIDERRTAEELTDLLRNRLPSMEVKDQY